jgi:hypothetical protein
MPTNKGADGLDYYILDHQIRVVFYSANMTFSLWYKNKLYGAVDAEYV